MLNIKKLSHCVKISIHKDIKLRLCIEFYSLFTEFKDINTWKPTYDFSHCPEEISSKEQLLPTSFCMPYAIYAMVLKGNTNRQKGFNMAISVKLDDGLKNRIQQLAEVRNRSAHWIMREAISDYVEREEIKEVFKQEAMASWKAYQENGRHLTDKEVGDWLDGWETDSETELPKCHE